MATPGYDGQVVGRDCDCEDFPCCGHGITQADVQSIEEHEFEMFERGYADREEYVDDQDEIFDEDDE